MKKLAVLAALSLFVLGYGSAASAQARANMRRGRQQERIAAGVASGQLNPNETARLEVGQARVNNAEARAQADGRVTGRERAHLERMQDRQSARIRTMRHNGR